MLVEVAPHHVAVSRPLVERVGGAVDGDEPLTVVMDEGEQVGLLRIVHVQLAGGEERDGVEGVQVRGVEIELLLGDELAIRPDHSFPQATQVSELP